MNEIIVIGGGASGMMAALAAAGAGAQVVLLEKMGRCGRKIRITGKGRCNVTTDKSREEILAQIRRNPKFMYSSLAAFDNRAVWEFFTERGCALWSAGTGCFRKATRRRILSTRFWRR